MARWGSEDQTRQQAEAEGAPQAAATGATQSCVCPSPPPTPPPPPPPGPGPVDPPVPIDPVTEIPVIVKVEWLDGAGTEVLAGEGEQIVNMPVDDKWVGTNLASNKRRLSHQPGYKVTFDRPGGHSFKVRLVPGGSNAAYTATEEPRNGKFKAEKDWVSGSTDGDGTKLVEVGSALTIAGGDSYSLEAQDDQATLVTSSNIKTIRAVHCVQIKMTGLTTIATSVAATISEYDKHHIRLVELASVEMPHLHNVGTDTSALETNVQTAWDGSEGKPKQPYALGMVFTDHLAVKNPAQEVIEPAVTVGPGQGPVVIDIIGPGLGDATLESRSLWIDLVPGEGWFVSASYTPDGGGAAITVVEAKCTPVAAGWNAKSFESVSVDVSALPAGTGTITLNVDWVDRMRGGISLGSMPTVLVCTRAWWRDKSTASQNQVLVHELGHQFGMVPVGSGSTLDRHTDQYTGSGHRGSHCHNGVPAAAHYGNSAANAASTCVLFGATNGKISYCPKCTPQVRKVDLSPGWT